MHVHQDLEQRVSELSDTRAELSKLQTDHVSRVQALEAQISNLEAAVRLAQQQGQGDAASAAKQVR